MENMILTETSIFYLSIVRKWAKFIAVFMFVMIGLMIFAGFFMGFAMNTLSSMSMENQMPFPGIFLTVFYVLMALIYFFPALYLYRFAQYLGYALSTGSVDELTTAFLFLKKHYTFIGVMTIVMIALSILITIFALVAGIFGLMAGSGGNQFI